MRQAALDRVAAETAIEIVYRMVRSDNEARLAYTVMPVLANWLFSTETRKSATVVATVF